MDFRQYLSMSSVSPQKILKIVVSISVVLLVMWLFMVSRMEFSGGNQEPRDPAVTERTDSVRALINPPEREAAGGERRSPGIFMNAVTTFLVMIVLLIAVWFLSRKRGRATEERMLREIGSHMLGQDQQLKMVEINEEVWVLGVASGSVHLLHRYPKEEWKEPRPDSDADNRSFYQLFRNKS